MRLYASVSTWSAKFYILYSTVFCYTGFIDTSLLYAYTAVNGISYYALV